MEHSESIKNLAKALAKFQGEVKDPAKNEKNPFFKSKYVPLDALIEAVRPTLSANGLSIIQMPSGDGKTISLKTIILHESGEWIESDLFSLVIAKADAQGAGSGVTYARRYQLGAVLNIGWTDDDDGNSISGHEVKTAPAPKPTPNVSVPRYHIIIASLDTMRDAQATVTLMESKGLQNLKIKEGSGHFRIVHSSFVEKDVANNKLNELKQQEQFKNAWLLCSK